MIVVELLFLPSLDIKAYIWHSIKHVVLYIKIKSQFRWHGWRHLTIILHNALLVVRGVHATSACASRRKKILHYTTALLNYLKRKLVPTSWRLHALGKHLQEHLLHLTCLQVWLDFVFISTLKVLFVVKTFALTIKIIQTNCRFILIKNSWESV